MGNKWLLVLGVTPLLVILLIAAGAVVARLFSSMSKVFMAIINAFYAIKGKIDLHDRNIRELERKVASCEQRLSDIDSRLHSEAGQETN